FLQQHDSRYHLSSEAIEALRRQFWSGNVRELRNLVSKAVIFANSFCIAPSDLTLVLETPEAPQSNAGSMVSLETIERQTIFKALEQASGHHQKAAALLGISRRTLSRRLKVYGASDTRQSSVA